MNDAQTARISFAAKVEVVQAVRWPYLTVPTAPIDERDIAAVAVRASCHDGHAGAEYVLTGPQSLSQFDQVSTIGRMIGRSLRIEEIPPDEARRESRRLREHRRGRCSTGPPITLRIFGSACGP